MYAPRSVMDAAQPVPTERLDAIPVPVLVLDLTELWDTMQTLRAGGRAEPDAVALAHDPELGEHLLHGVGGGHLNARGRAVFRGSDGDIPAAAIRHVLRWSVNAPLARAALMACWRGDAVFEGHALGLSGTGRPVPLSLSFSPPRTRPEAAAVVVYLSERTADDRAGPLVGHDETWFRLMFDRAQHGLALLDTQGRWLRVNEALCRLLGYTATELKALTVADVTHPDDIPHDLAWFSGLRDAPERQFTREKRYIRKDGRVVWANVSGGLISSPNSVGTGDGIIMGHIHDITTRKTAEDALIQSEARFRQSFEHAGHGMALITLDGRFLSANRAFCKTLGLSVADLGDCRLDDLTHDADRQTEQALRHRLLRGDLPAFEVEKRFVINGSPAVWVRASVILIRDAANRPLSFMYQTLDMTEQRRAQARARIAESQLLGAIETIDDGVLLFDENERLILVNSSFRNNVPEMAGILDAGPSFHEFIIQLLDLGYVVPPEGMSRAAWIRWRMGQHRSATTHTFEVSAHDGRHFLVREGRTADGSTLVLRSDITEMKRRENALSEAKKQAEEASRIKSEFLANMSHELLTPLNAIIGFSEVLLKELHGPLGAPVYGDYVRNVLTAGQHLLEVLTDILELSRLESGDSPLVEALESPASVLADCRDRYRAEAERRDIAFSLSVQPDLPWLRCDSARFRQILDKLVSNALKFTPPGGSVAVQGRLARSGQLVISVADTGVGMSKDEISVAMSNFGQVQGVFARSEGGTGLGLPLCRAWVEAHGGTLEVISRPGSGVTVIARFPASRVLSAPHAHPAGANGHAINGAEAVTPSAS